MNMGKSKKRWKGFSVLTAAVLSAGTLIGTLTAFGAQAEAHPDLSRKGSVSVTMIDKTTGQPVGKGAMTLYQVADAVREDWNDSFFYTEAFSECQLALDSLESGELAAGLAAYAKEKDIAGENMTIGDDGVVKYTDLELGLYLLVQSEAASGYEAVSPFLVSVPTWINGEANYDIDATPKTSGVTPGTAAPTRPPSSGGSSDDDDDDDWNDNNNSSVKPTKPTESPELETVVITDETDPDPTKPDPGDPEVKEPDPGVLPKTGQLWWPVPFLAAAGLLLFLLGQKDRRRQG